MPQDKLSTTRDAATQQIVHYAAAHRALGQ